LEICNCQTAKSKIVFSEKKTLGLGNFLNEKTWLINQWTRKSHPSHFAFKMVPTGIIFGMREKFFLPKVFDNIYWQDYKTKQFSDFEQNVFDIAMSHENVTVKKNVFSNENNFFCFKTTFTHQKLQVYSEKKEHLKYFQQYSEEKIGIKNNIYGNIQNSCPPLKAVIIVRSQGNGKRKLIGDNYIKNYLKQYNISLEKVTISSQNSSSEQAKIFNSYGLIISSHSSQLANLLFAQKKQLF
jgi:hypothetical protein